MTHPLLEGLYTGMPRELAGARAPWTSSFGRTAATGRLALGLMGLPADLTFEPEVHGGPDRALLAYASAHYPRWRAEYPHHAFAEPAFAENLRVAGLDEDSVCIGDVWEVGSARVQVSMPRWPCAKISTYHGLPDLLARVFATGRIGWLLRVLEPGEIEVGDGVQVVESLNPAWTVARAYQVYFALRAAQGADLAAARELAALPGLAQGWREGIEAKLERLHQASANGE